MFFCHPVSKGLEIWHHTHILLDDQTKRRTTFGEHDFAALFPRPLDDFYSYLNSSILTHRSSASAKKGEQKNKNK